MKKRTHYVGFYATYRLIGPYATPESDHFFPEHRKENLLFPENRKFTEERTS
jgi:hypothetical protein